jgi:hypothetical protein
MRRSASGTMCQMAQRKVQRGGMVYEMKIAQTSTAGTITTPENAAVTAPAADALGIAWSQTKMTCAARTVLHTHPLVAPLTPITRPAPPVAWRPRLTGQSVQLSILPCTLAIHAGLHRCCLERCSLMQPVSQFLDLAADARGWELSRRSGQCPTPRRSDAGSGNDLACAEA